MADLGIVITPGSDPFTTLADLSREAENAGFSAIFVSESSNDSLMCCTHMALATSRVKLVTWIVNIHFRVPLTCAAAAASVGTSLQGERLLVVSSIPAITHLPSGSRRHR